VSGDPGDRGLRYRMKNGTQQSSRHVYAVFAALDILECFERDSALSLKQIIDISGMTRNRVMRMTGTLEARGYLVRSGASGKFMLGPQILVLGKIMERSFDLVLLARPLLKELSRLTGESASLYVVSGNERLVLAREEGTHDIRYSVFEGQRLPIYAGAGGKVLLAFGPEEIRSRILRKIRFSSLTAQTITEAKTLKAELERIRTTGYAVSRAERAPDAGSIAAPVFGHNRNLMGAIAIAGPVSRVNLKSQPSYLAHVLKTAERLSRQLGWRSSGLSALKE